MQILRRIVCLLPWLWSAALAAAPQPIMVYGDSLSAEYGLERGTGWAALLAARLKEKNYDYIVVNSSISGETASGGASRIAAELSRVKPAVVVVELGGNDGLRGLSLDATRANLEAIVTTAQKAGARVVVCGMQLPPNYGRDYTTRFRALFGEVASRHKAALVPFFLEGVGERRDLFQADGIHPTVAAQPRLLENVWPVLEPLLKSRKGK
jgi:acyl-CoA thioesterase-1